MVLRYRVAVLWSAFVGLAGVNWGLDVLLSNNVISILPFQRDFRYLYNGSYIVSASWEVAFNTAASIGGFFGSIASGYVASRVGEKRTLAIGCVLSIAAIFMQVFADSKELLLVSKVLVNGFALGSFLTIPSNIAAELSPVGVRGVTTASVQLFIGIGQLIANLVLKGTGTLGSNIAYKLPFALQFVFPVILLVGLPFCPESPWYLLRQQKYDETRETLARLGYRSSEAALAEIVRTFEMESNNGI